MKANIYVIATLSSLFSAHTMADSILTWSGNSIDDTFLAGFKLELFESKTGYKNVALIFPSDGCKQFSADQKTVPSYVINNTKVKFVSQCFGNNLRADYPKTYIGARYLVSQLLLNKSVTYEQGDLYLTFRSDGFEYSYKHFDSNSGGI